MFGLPCDLGTFYCFIFGNIDPFWRVERCSGFLWGFFEVFVLDFLLKERYQWGWHPFIWIIFSLELNFYMNLGILKKNNRKL